MRTLLAITLFLAATIVRGQDTTIIVHADRPTGPVSPYLTGVCIEDVNHEIYGGLYSQMIFGESFAEPPASAAPKGFAAYGGSWEVKEDRLIAGAGDGPRLVAQHPPISAGEVAIDVRFPDDSAGLAGLIVNVAQPQVGADHFVGYEISLDPKRQLLVLGRHRNNWEHVRDVPCAVSTDKWIGLAVRIADRRLEVLVDGKSIAADDNSRLSPGRIGLRTWKRTAEFRNLTIKTKDGVQVLPFEWGDARSTQGMSGMWRGFSRGSAAGSFALDTNDPFTGRQSQRLTFDSGQGECGIENRGLNRQGLGLVARRDYQGYAWLRAEKALDLVLALESSDGEKTYGQTKIHVDTAQWKRFDFSLTSDATDSAARFAIKLNAPGSLVVGHVLLQPGDWGRFKGLPVRKDVIDGLREMGVSVMRYGGSMVNAPEYRWKKMIGPRDRRPGYKGTWYEHSSNGWGIIDFLNLCEAMEILAVPDFNIDESPEDMADFIEYVNGQPDTQWGAKRALDGHAAAYRLKYLELGNEEAVDETYRAKFEKLAEAIWQKDPTVTPVIGDFEYKQPIADPMNFKGAPRIRSLSSHQKILEFAKSHQKPVWFDVHIWNHKPGDAAGPVAGLESLAGWFEKLAPGADFKVCVFEENAVNHAMLRALAHAETINGLERLAKWVPIVCAANGLQVDGQNDNGWDQGLLFMNPSKAWLQPPGYVTQMIARQRLGQCIGVDVKGTLNAAGQISADRKRIALRIVNPADHEVTARIEIQPAWANTRALHVSELSGPLDGVNSSDDPQKLAPKASAQPAGNPLDHTFPPRSVTILRFE